MKRLTWIGLATLTVACSGGSAGLAPDGTGAAGGQGQPGTGGESSVPGVVPEEHQAQLESILPSLAEVRELDSAGLEQRYPTSFDGELGYIPEDALWLDRIQDSSLMLNEEELGALNADGFAISDRHSFPDFTYGYKTIYFEDLPVFVSLDSVLYAIHRSYDSLLLSVERDSLIPTLDSLLASLNAKLSSAGLPASTAADLEIYLEVASSLLTGETPTNPAAAALVAKANAADGMEAVELFGVQRNVDFSQFQPRGHYAESEELERYFRSMIWLGRIDLRLIETRTDGSRELHRPQVEAMLGLFGLFDETDRERWDTLDTTIAVFVGEPDSMMLPDVDRFLDDLGITSLAELGSVSDQQIETVLEEGRYGMQRIASHLMVTDDIVATLPLNTSYTFMGQRYVVDSHVFSNVVYDRVPSSSDHPKRMMPNPLDVAFAALGNDQARTLLQSEIDQYGYAQQLAETRILVDAHEEQYWDSSLYTLWLSTLRSVSPSADTQAGLPSVARSEHWGRRLLNTQLASWAELRHDTLLYAKQSYTGMPSCEYPDAYVDPYPEAFGNIARFADKGIDALQHLESGYALTHATEYLTHLSDVATLLQQMAEHQRTGLPHTQEQIDFINEAVAIEDRDVVCATVPEAVGWYPKLFLNPEDALNADPTIADVHTQPADAAGNIVGRVLHVGTGGPRLMVVTVESCEGPRAYAGLVSTYFERTTENFERLTDETWASELSDSTPPDVPWMADIVTR